jgi:hypothetical protein
MRSASNTTRSGPSVTDVGIVPLTIIFVHVWLTVLVEEKYGRAMDNPSEESETDSEDDVSEDDDAELATEALDAEISATLNAIRSKDPRVYNPDITFYHSIQDTGRRPRGGCQWCEEGETNDIEGLPYQEPVGGQIRPRRG